MTTHTLMLPSENWTAIYLAEALCAHCGQTVTLDEPCEHLRLKVDGRAILAYSNIPYENVQIQVRDMDR